MEEELDYLINQFWNHVHLGQWELACTFSHFIKDISENHYENILVAIVLEPEKYSTGSKTISTPFHLSWLAAKELQKYTKIDESRLPPQILKELEFKILLHNIEERTSFSVLEELSAYHTQLLNHALGLAQISEVEMFSSSACELIGELIAENPLIALSLTEMLTGKSDIYKLNNLCLCQLYVNQISIWMDNVSFDESSSVNLDTFFHVLSCAKKYLNSADLSLVDHFNKLTRKLLKNNGSLLLNLYTSLLDWKDTGLIIAVDHVELNYIVESCIIGRDLAEHTIRLAEIISQLFCSSQEKDWQKLFILCYHYKIHILQCILDGCLCFIDQKEYQKAASLISSPSLKALTPLVLLLAWMKCSDFNEATLLLKYLLDEDDLPGVLGTVCKKLKYQTQLIQWCMEKAKAILGPDYDTSILLNVLFKQLESSSVLSVLNKTNLLKMLKNEEVVDILEQQLVLEDIPQNNIQSGNEVEIFISFTILKRFINLVIASRNGVLIEHDGVKVPFTIDLVKTYLTELKIDIIKIEPITLRLEVLENIFSLLFLQASNFKGQHQEDIDYDNIEDRSMNSSMSYSIMSQSLESLSTLGDDPGDGKSSPSLTRNTESARNAKAALFRTWKSLDMSFKKVDGIETLMQKMEGSSTGTIKEILEEQSNLLCTQSSFLVNTEILRETLLILSDCLLQITGCRFGDVTVTSPDKHSLKSSILKSRIDNHISRLSQYTREALWRLELIAGFETSPKEAVVNVPKLSITEQGDHVINKMLGSSETLVYLTMKKGDIIQAKQVIKMFNLTEHECCKEVDFVEQLDTISEKLLKISKPERKERTHSTLDFVKSAASAGKISAEVNQTAEMALQHPFIVEQDSQLMAMATCVDFIFMSPLPYNICKTLVDLASLKVELCQDSSLYKVCAQVSPKLKDIKALIQLATSRDLKVFQLCGQKKPTDFLSLSVFTISKLYPDFLEFEESKLLQGQSAFIGLSDRIGALQGKYKELVDEVEERVAVSLKERASNLFAIFNSDTCAQINGINTAHDYFKALFKYVKSLSSLQLYYKNRNNDHVDNIRPLSTSKAANPFLIFNESISTIFGRLLFEWGMSPKRLESFAHQSGINLVKVVAENCGVSAPSTLCKIGIQQRLLLKEQLVMNKNDEDSSTGIEPGKCPNSVVEELLNSVLDMISENGQYTPSQLTASEVCQVLKVSTGDLEKVDLNVLKTAAEKTSFFINLFNLMFLHGLMLVLSEKFDASFNFINTDFSLLLQNSFGRLVLHDLLVYQVGDIGCLSAFELYQYVFLRGSKTQFFDIMEDPLWHLWFPSLYKYAGESFCDYRCLFMLSHGSLDSPLVQVVYPNKLETMLKSCTMEYLDVHVGVDNENKEVFLAEFVVLLKNHFLQAKNTLTQEDISSEKEELYPLLTVLCTFASPSLKAKLKHAVKEKFTITIEKHDWNLRHAQCKKVPEINKENAMLTYPQFSQISEQISLYLSDTSPLVGTFINLCLARNNLVKSATTIFDNNILHSSSDKDNALNVFTSIQKGLEIFTKQTAHYSVLKNFVFESSSIVINFLENVSTFESLLDSHNLKLSYASIRSLLTHNFLSTLSPKDWSEIIPTLIHCCLYSHTCHIIPLQNLELITSLPPTLFDLICCHGIAEIKSTLQMMEEEVNQYRISESMSDFQNKLKILLLLIKDKEKKCYMLLNNVHHLDSKNAIDLLKLCLEFSLDSTLEKTLKYKLHEITWYENVFLASKMCGKCDAFFNWQDVKLQCTVDPERVVSFLISIHQYDLLDTWCEDFDVSEDLLQIAVKSKLENVLKEHSTDYLQVQSILEKITSREMLVTICLELLKERSCYSNKYLFIIKYMTSSLIDLISPNDKCNILLNKIGILSIEIIPSEFKDSYKHLQHSPLLILEQLLMNVKVTVAGKVVKLIHKESSENNLLSSLLSEADDLIAKYASLSIDLTILQTSNTPVHTPLLTPTHTPTLSRKIFNRSMHSPTQERITSPVDVFASAVEQVKTEEEFRERKASSISHSKEKEEFVPPLSPVDKKDWVKDDQVSSCMKCHDLFNMFNRRHHCRHCGRVVCASCSRFYCFMERYDRKERTCGQCYQYSYQTSSLKDVDVSEGPSKQLSSSPQCSTRIINMDTPSPLPIGLDEPEWILSTDSHINVAVREEFAFEQAPSASLCLGVVDLYSNQRAAGGLLLKFCNNLSQYLQLHNKGDEVDVNMIAGMIEFILNHAKIKFLKANDYGGVELCDTHLSRVEILKILIEANWHHIPTMQELTQLECLRRLRDRLIENEHFSLAMEVSSKCALDATPVNFIMGISRLKCGDLEKAREYFARCLTVNRGEASKGFGPVNHYLERIIEVIQNSPLIALNHISVDDSSLSPVTFLLEHYKNTSGECCLDKRRYEEIMFYLSTYGTRAQVIMFFTRNRLLKKAVLYIREKKCSHDLFISKLLLPCFQDGCFDQLCEEIKVNDPALKFWGAYFTEGCKYFSKHTSYHCLYELQLFIKDFFRGALTCVRFYLGTASGPPSSYTDLYGRLSYLHLANKHLDHLVKERSNRSSFVSHVGSSFMGDDKNLSNQEIPTSELKRHLSTVNLQIDVTKFLCDVTTVDNSHGDKKIPTLFGNGKERADLAIKLLVWSGGDSLALTSRIIQEFKLPSPSIFGRALKSLARSCKYAEVTSILRNVEQNGMIVAKEKDEILQQVIKVVTQFGQMKDANQFIKQIKADLVKINSLIMCGRLKDAYLEAVKSKRATEIQRILDEARKSSSQRNMIDICERWLKNHQENQLRTEKALSKS
ncbi:zinc finger FYVE domain-containing protein 26-like [Hydractinia symbiolongicarpus]|uniref:zinc finger FYVE domain-containing protein 26-like n=1 Tax=Hydractinia symbiolongicarpus TaxID=13093 RepID=UPI00254C239A|nr:zinc finger FYVE domain-containing protein 26-like [Hydractinia symbiolongicarpus]